MAPVCSYSYYFHSLWLLSVLLSSSGVALAQDGGSDTCYGPGSIAAAVILSILFTVALLAALYFFLKKFRKPKAELILETDPERGDKKGEYAFDNPGFKEPGFTPIAKSLDNKGKPDSVQSNGNGNTRSAAKWNQWSPITALTTKLDKRKGTLDDSAIDGNEVKVVALRSHDFTGLGFNICGNMKEGIFIKDVLHRGPAHESGKLNSGDRINSVTISFEHMVYEDALAILSYASPYEVILEAKGGKTICQSPTGQGGHPLHPMYRSSSSTDLFTSTREGSSTAKKKLFEHSPSTSNTSSLKKSMSNMTTLERRESPTHKNNYKTTTKSHLSPEQLKVQLEKKIMADHEHNLNLNVRHKELDHVEAPKSENKFQKFGVRVLPLETSPKIVEQNDNNINLEVDDRKPQAKKREKKSDFDRGVPTNNSGIRRDENGIPQEIPAFMANAAQAARSNRKTSNDETPKKSKGKAPAPPPMPESSSKNYFDEIQTVSDAPISNLPNVENGEDAVELRQKHSPTSKDYNSDDSDQDTTDNLSSVNTIELNSSDITVHQNDESNNDSRKTASTGDLTKIKTRKSSTGTLERAQSLDITTDNNKQTASLKRKADIMASDEDIFGKVMMSKEPRLSLILDGLTTFQRNRLKKSTEWGNLEDAILKVNNSGPDDREISLEDVRFGGYGETSHEFDALVNKINEIKRESVDLSEELTPPKKKNQIWPTFEQVDTSYTNGGHFEGDDKNPRLASVNKRQRMPDVQDGVHLPPVASTEVVPTVETKVTSTSVSPESKIPTLSGQKMAIKPPLPDKKPAKVGDQEDNSEKTRKLLDLTKNFIFTEKIACSRDEDDYYNLYSINKADLNISDDIKVSRHSLGSLERPKSDDFKISSVSNPLTPEMHSLELNVNGDSDMNLTELSELYTTALDKTLSAKPLESKITISTPDIIKNVTLTEAINTLNNDVTIHGPSSLVPSPPNTYTVDTSNVDSDSSQTYVTEIQVHTPSKSNVSEIEIVPDDRNLDTEFEDYVKNFESTLEHVELPPLKIELEKERHKIEEIAEAQLKKLPEMKFSISTSSYVESTPQPNRSQQVDMLRSNFEKSPSPIRSKSESVTKSRIPIATTGKTPPTSPERRDSRNLDLTENDARAILELMSSPPTVHSTPRYGYTNGNKSRNVTVTSIRNSKIPSGLPVLGGSRPPIPPKNQNYNKSESDQNVVHVSTNGVEQGGHNSSFKEWVFNPDLSHNSVTNIVVSSSSTKK